MKLGVLFSGGKDSNYAMYLAKKAGYEISVLITIESENQESYMFHTPSISKVKRQAEVLRIPLIIEKTKGEKEKELIELENAIKKSIKEYNIEGIVTGAIESVYQATRIQKICNQLSIECFNPLWQKNQIELLEELVKNKFEVVIIGVFAYPFDKKMLGRKIDSSFINEMKKMKEKYKINPSGEGGEYESYVLYSPMFEKKLKVLNYKDIGEGNSWIRKIELK